MRYPVSKKRETIQIVEQLHLPVKRSLDQLRIRRRTFYSWYDHDLDGGPAAVEDRPSTPSRVRNCIPDAVPDQLIELALEQSELLPRELRVRSTEEKRYFVSAATRYILIDVCLYPPL